MLPTNRALLLALGAAMAASATADVGAQPGLITSEVIYETAPFPSCHASTIVETKSGLVAAWFGGQREGAADVGIWVSRRIADKWTTPVEVASGVQADGTRHPCWNPVLFAPQGGPLQLFYKVGPDPRHWWGVVRTSTDDGAAWSAARRLQGGILGPIKNKPVQLKNGDWLAPSSTETPLTHVWRVHFEKSSDGGATWTKAAPAPNTPGGEIDAIQPSILLHTDGKLQAIGRTRSGKIFETWSGDSGNSWTPLGLLALPNPNAGTDAVTLRDGRHLLVYNHTAKGRSPLNVAVSRDGKTWEAALILENEPGEYSYPAVIQSADGLVHITYTWKRQRISHAVLDPTKLETKPMVDGQWPH